eukprot:1339117-Amorphochlora_amoeboformis.AAC.1
MATTSTNRCDTAYFCVYARDRILTEGKRKDTGERETRRNILFLSSSQKLPKKKEIGGEGRRSVEKGRESERNVWRESERNVWSESVRERVIGMREREKERARDRCACGGGVCVGVR